MIEIPVAKDLERMGRTQLVELIEDLRNERAGIPAEVGATLASDLNEDGDCCAGASVLGVEHAEKARVG